MDLYEKYARRVPDEVRSQRLMIPADPIGSAVAVTSNPKMQELFAIYSLFVNPNADHLDINCHFCLARILDTFQRMQPYLVQLESEAEFLKACK